MLITLPVWESIEHHKALMNNKELYPVLCEHLDKGVAKFDFVRHVTLGPNDPYPALEAPLTEFANWKMHEGADRAKFVNNFTLFVKEGIEKLPVKMGGWGASVEDDGQFTVVTGWESVEVRKLFSMEQTRLIYSAQYQRLKNAAMANPWLQGTVAELNKFADVDVKRVVLVKHSK